MKNYKYINDYTGEVYTSLWEAFKTIIHDMKYYMDCKTIKMFKIKKI